MEGEILLTCCDRSTILVPLHFHCRIADWGELSFEVGITPFLQLPQLLERSDERWSLGRSFLHTFSSLVT